MLGLSIHIGLHPARRNETTGLLTEPKAPRLRPLEYAAYNTRMDTSPVLDRLACRLRWMDQLEHFSTWRN